MLQVCVPILDIVYMKDIFQYGFKKYFEGFRFLKLNTYWDVVLNKKTFLYSPDPHQKKKQKNKQQQKKKKQEKTKPKKKKQQQTNKQKNNL